jgi:hypothetical protein
MKAYGGRGELKSFAGEVPSPPKEKKKCLEGLGVNAVIISILTKLYWKVWTELTWLITASCEHSKDLSVSIKCRKLSD